MVAEALVVSAESVEHFTGSLAGMFKRWLLFLPPGVGSATLKSIVRLWGGVGPARAGVYSAGNGPAMRSAIIGAYHAYDSLARRDIVFASSRLTHSDPRAAVAALAVAEVAASIVVLGRPETSRQISHITSLLRECGRDDIEWLRRIELLEKAMRRDSSVQEFARDLGCGDGVSGYAYETVPVAIYAWWCNPGNYRQTVTDAILCGGDTDSVAAIAGALAGLSTRGSDIPEDWSSRIICWTTPIAAFPDLGQRLSTSATTGATLVGGTSIRWRWAFVENLVCLGAIVTHLFARAFWRERWWSRSG